MSKPIGQHIPPNNWIVLFEFAKSAGHPIDGRAIKARARVLLNQGKLAVRKD